MFCASCGTAVTIGLSYCNRCGSKIGLSNSLEIKQADKLTEIVHMLGIVSGAVVIGGFIFVFLLVEKLLERGLNASATLTFMMMSLAAVFGIAWLLIRQLSRTLNAHLRVHEVEPPKQVDTAPIPMLESAREPVSSVTEHTTRAFEPSIRERTGSN